MQVCDVALDHEWQADQPFISSKRRHLEAKHAPASEHVGCLEGGVVVGEDVHTQLPTWRRREFSQ